MARWFRDFHPKELIRRILRIDDTPHSIAFGTSIGMLIAMTPTIGIQVIVAAAVCTALRANRLAGIVMVFISNPLTMVPIYWADYWLGAKLIGAAMISKEDFAAIWRRITDAGMIGWVREAFVVLTGEIFLPMMLGGTLIGLALAVPLYPITFRAVTARRRRREMRQAYLRLRELRARGETDPLSSAPPAGVVRAAAAPVAEGAPRRVPAGAESAEAPSTETTGGGSSSGARIAETPREESLR
jgi:hypothetical protein